ncbi:MAG: SDR family oxidoreductase [Candidatus Eisenbacteria bacterium]|nr:SDR family oxidoreductase [Candidatus Eisenbacteria bacterium]
MTRKIVVYGGSGGIGSATGRILSERGYDLHLVGRKAEKLEAIAGELGASYTVGDVTDPGLFARVTQEAGESLDGLVYAVGTIKLRSLQRLTEADFIDDIRVNAVGAALAVQAGLRAFKRCAGIASVVLFASVAVHQGFSLHAATGMAKGAVAGLVVSLAAELSPKVRVNAVAPSLTRTPLAKGMLVNEQMAEAVAGLHAMQRLGAPEDIAALTAFLLSPEADWITGQIVGVDGGRSTLRTKNG